MPPRDTTELIIGTAPQFFFDNGILGAVQNVTRTLHSPRKIESNPVIRSDRPWEHVTYFTFNSWHVWHDPDSGRTNCVYEDWQLDRDRLVNEARGTIHAWTHARMRQLYAYSDDGVEFVKPAMGNVVEEGHDTNIVLGSEEFGSVHSPTIIDDPWETDPERRFKIMFFHVPPELKEVGGGLPMVAHSPDGIHWTHHDQPPVVGSERAQLDDCGAVIADPESHGYLSFTRHPLMSGSPDFVRMPPLNPTGGTPTYDVAVDVPHRRNRRRVFIMESSDFQHWTTPRLVLAPDPEIDNLDTAFYGMKPYRIGTQWLGFLSILNMVSNTMHVELVHSRDGRSWRRVAPGRPWLEPGPPGAWDQFMVNANSAPLAVDGDELRVYFGGARNHHDWWFAGPTENRDDPSRWNHAPEVDDMGEVGYALGLARIRRDGFVSLDASLEREGVIATEPFVTEGDTLLINACCRAGGYVKVEVTDTHDRPLAGAIESDCDPFTGDSVAHTVTWGGRPTIPMATRDIDDIRMPAIPYRRLRFTLRGAELYSFQIVPSGSGD